MTELTDQEHVRVLDALGLTVADVEAYAARPVPRHEVVSQPPNLEEVLRPAAGRTAAAPGPAPARTRAPAPGAARAPLEPAGDYRLDATAFGAALAAALDGNVAGYSFELREAGRTVVARSHRLARTAGDGGLAWSSGVPMHVASVSKLVGAIALTRALRDAGLPRTAPVSPWLPLYWNWGPNVTSVTFEHLMLHTTGFNWNGVGGQGPAGTPGDAHFALAKAEVQAGTSNLNQAAYRNVNYTLVRIVLATLTGAVPVSATAPFLLDPDAYWDVATAVAFDNYVRGVVLTPSGAGGSRHSSASTALAYPGDASGTGWDSGDVSDEAAGVGWHMSVDDVLDVVGTLRRAGTVLSREQALEMLTAGCGTDADVALTLGTVRWKGGWWQLGTQVAQSSVYLLPRDMELGVLANSGFGTGVMSLVPQVWTAIEASTLLDLPIRGVLLAGGFRTQSELNAMSFEDMRNTLIVELSKHSNQAGYQAYDNHELAGMGAVMVFLRRFGIRSDAELRRMSADDQRNTLIVELDLQTGAGARLQGFRNLDLVLIGLGSDLAWRGQVPGLVSSWIRGVLLLGGFRTQRELNAMSQEDMRNTLIVELTNRTNQTDYQGYHNADLEGFGAILVLLRAFGARTDAQLRQMSADDMRNTLIVELDAQTGTGLRLQRLSNLQLALTALGVWERRG